MIRDIVRKILYVAFITAMNNTYAFDMYIQTGYIDEPDFLLYGFKCSEIIYEQQLYSTNEDRLNNIKDLVILNHAKRLAGSPQCPVVLDIEYWMDKSHRGSHREKVEVLHRYADIVNKFKKLLPQHEIGLYGIVPAWAHWDIIKYQNRYEQWQSDNNAALVVADAVDVFHPSLYTYHSNFDEWKMWASEIIAKSRTMSPNKKIIPYIWPKYHQSSTPYKKGVIDLPEEFWLSQLEFLREHADGFVIWNGALGSEGKWDKNVGWWKITRQFITKYKLENK